MLICFRSDAAKMSHQNRLAIDVGNRTRFLLGIREKLQRHAVRFRERTPLEFVLVPFGKRLIERLKSP